MLVKLVALGLRISELKKKKSYRQRTHPHKTHRNNLVQKWPSITYKQKKKKSV